MGRRGKCRFPGALAGPAAGGAPRGPAQAAPPAQPRTQRTQPCSWAEQTCLSEDRSGAGGACTPGSEAAQGTSGLCGQQAPCWALASLQPHGPTGYNWAGAQGALGGRGGT